MCKQKDESSLKKLPTKSKISSKKILHNQLCLKLTQAKPIRTEKLKKEDRLDQSMKHF